MRRFLFLFIVLFNCAENETDTFVSDELTVEGHIREGEFAEIRLTNSLPFRGVIDSVEVVKSIESKAKVVLSNGDESEILTLKRNESSFPFLYYRSNIIRGEIGEDYNLSISIRGKEFVSETSVPEKTKILKTELLDWIEDGIPNPDFKDIKLTIENESLKERYFKVLIKSESDSKFEFARPFIFNTENIFTDTFPIIVSYIYFDDEGELVNRVEVGETIEVKIVTITKEQFDFWKSIEGDQTSPLENSSFTNKIVSNINNGAFGYWSGENITYLKLKIE